MSALAAGTHRDSVLRASCTSGAARSSVMVASPSMNAVSAARIPGRPRGLARAGSSLIAVGDAGGLWMVQSCEPCMTTCQQRSRSDVA